MNGASWLKYYISQFSSECSRIFRFFYSGSIFIFNAFPLIDVIMSVNIDFITHRRKILSCSSAPGNDEW